MNEKEELIQSIIQQANKIKDIQKIKGKYHYVTISVRRYLQCQDNYTNKLLPIVFIVEHIEENLYEIIDKIA